VISRCCGGSSRPAQPIICSHPETRKGPVEGWWPEAMREVIGRRKSSRFDRRTSERRDRGGQEWNTSGARQLQPGFRGSDHPGAEHKVIRLIRVNRRGRSATCRAARAMPNSRKQSASYATMWCRSRASYRPKSCSPPSPTVTPRCGGDRPASRVLNSMTSTRRRPEVTRQRM